MSTFFTRLFCSEPRAVSYWYLDIQEMFVELNMILEKKDEIPDKSSK